MSPSLILKSHLDKVANTLTQIPTSSCWSLLGASTLMLLPPFAPTCHTLPQASFRNADQIMSLPSSKVINGSPLPLAESSKFHNMPFQALHGLSQLTSLAFTPNASSLSTRCTLSPSHSDVFHLFLPPKFCFCCFHHLEYTFFPIPPSLKVTHPLRHTSNASPFPEPPSWSESPCPYNIAKCWS